MFACLTRALFGLIISQITGWTSEPQRPIARIDLISLFNIDSTEPDDVTPVFLSEETIAVNFRNTLRRPMSSKFWMLPWASPNTGSTSGGINSNVADGLYAVRGGRLLGLRAGNNFLYSQDFRDREPLPIRIIVEPFPQTAAIGEYGQGEWAVYRALPRVSILRKGVGELQSVSDQYVIYRRDDTIFAETLEGRLLGSFHVDQKSRGLRIAEIASGSHLYLSGSGNTRIVDFDGKDVVQIHPPGGWASRHGWSADGNRILFDHFTRTIPQSQRVAEAVKAVATLGLGAIDEQPNGETIRVIDTRTGRVCFSLESPSRLFGVAGGYHADLSPSGRLLALSTTKYLSIYRLPEVCKEN